MGRGSRAIRHELRYWALRLLLGGARPLPLSSLRAGGALLGLAALALSRQSRRHVRHNLELAYPDQSDDWRAGLALRTARHAGKLLGEVAWLWSVGPRRLLARTRFEGVMKTIEGDESDEESALDSLRAKMAGAIDSVRRSEMAADKTNAQSSPVGAPDEA